MSEKDVSMNCVSHLWTFAYVLDSVIINNGTGRIYIFRID